MTAPAYAGPYQFGPGTLMIGAVGAPIDFSCLVNHATLTIAGTTGNPVTKLCGTSFPGLSTFAGKLDGNVDLDIADLTNALFEMCSKNAGTVQEFRFQPSTAGILAARGQLIVMPLPFGGAAYGNDLTGDFSWDTIGNITYYRDLVLAWTQNMSPRAGVLPAP